MFFVVPSEILVMLVSLQTKKITTTKQVKRLNHATYANHQDSNDVPIMFVTILIVNSYPLFSLIIPYHYYPLVMLTVCY